MTKTKLSIIMLTALMFSTVTILTTPNAFAENGVLTDEELAALDEELAVLVESTAAVSFTKVDQVNLSSGKQVDIYEGTHTIPFSGTFSATLSGFTIDASPEAKFTIVTADGQGQIAPSTLNFNAGVIANPFLSVDGQYWDTVTRDVSAFVSAGDVSATVVSSSSNDCIVHQAIIFAEGTPGDAGGYEAAGVGLRNTGSGIITIAGIPASDNAVKAILYWNLLNPSSPGNIVTFDGNPVAGTLIGTDTDPCWSAGTTWAYRADVTSLISGNGNGAYPITVPSAGSILPEGATLVVIHDDDQLSIILQEIKEIWMAIQDVVIPLLEGIETTVTNIETTVNNIETTVNNIDVSVRDNLFVTDVHLKDGQVMVLLDNAGIGGSSDVEVTWRLDETKCLLLYTLTDVGAGLTLTPFVDGGALSGNPAHQDLTGVEAIALTTQDMKNCHVNPTQGEYIGISTIGSTP